MTSTENLTSTVSTIEGLGPDIINIREFLRIGNSNNRRDKTVGHK